MNPGGADPGFGAPDSNPASQPTKQDIEKKVKDAKTITGKMKGNASRAMAWGVIARFYTAVLGDSEHAKESFGEAVKEAKLIKPKPQPHSDESMIAPSAGNLTMPAVFSLRADDKNKKPPSATKTQVEAGSISDAQGSIPDRSFLWPVVLGALLFVVGALVKAIVDAFGKEVAKGLGSEKAADFVARVYRQIRELPPDPLLAPDKPGIAPSA